MVGRSAAEIVCVCRHKYSYRPGRQNLECPFDESEQLRVFVGEILVSRTFSSILLCGVVLLPHQVCSPAGIEDEPSNQEKGAQHHRCGRAKCTGTQPLD